jgi:hypothetical protein
MKSRIAAISTVAVLSALVLASAAAAAMIGVYRNSMESEAQRAQVVRLSGERCGRGGSDHALRVIVGKGTRECTYRTPVIGRDLEVAAIGRLLSNTPPAAQRKAFLAINLRAGAEGAGYQLALFPLQGKAQLRKLMPDGQVRYLHIEKGIAAKGLNKASELRLSAINVTSGPERGSCHLLASVDGKLVADVTDAAAGELEARASGVALGAVGNAKGTVGSFDDVVVRVPSPF